MTETQYRHTVADVFGAEIKVNARFEPEKREDGLLAIGSAQLSLTSSGFEQYFALAGSISDKTCGCWKTYRGPRRQSSGEKTHISFALRVDALPAFVMTPDAGQEVASVASYKANAPQEPVAPQFTFRVVDGIVPDRNGKILAGPNAVILPPPDSANKPRQ